MRSWPPRERVPTRSAPARDALGGVCTTCSVVVGSLRAVLGQWAGGGLPLPQGKSPSTVARLAILFGPEPHSQGSGSIALRDGGGSRKLADALLGVHTPSKNPPPVSRAQAYIALHLSSDVRRTSPLRRYPKFTSRVRVAPLPCPLATRARTLSTPTLSQAQSPLC
jgi:hypothetical protein